MTSIRSTPAFQIFISARSSVLRLALAGQLLRFFVRFLRMLKRPRRVLHRLPGMFVSRQVILFAVMRGCHAVRVRGKFVEFCGSLM